MLYALGVGIQNTNETLNWVSRLLFYHKVCMRSIRIHLLFDGVVDKVGEGLDGHLAFLFGTLLADRNEALLGFFLTYDEHIRNTFQLVVTNLAANLLVAVVHNRTYVLVVEDFLYLVCVLVRLFADRKNNHLVRCQPQWEFTCGVLNEYKS